MDDALKPVGTLIELRRDSGSMLVNLASPPEVLMLRTCRISTQLLILRALPPPDPAGYQVVLVESSPSTWKLSVATPAARQTVSVASSQPLVSTYSSPLKR